MLHLLPLQCFDKLVVHSFEIYFLVSYKKSSSSKNSMVCINQSELDPNPHRLKVSPIWDEFNTILLSYLSNPPFQQHWLDFDLQVNHLYSNLFSFGNQARSADLNVFIFNASLLSSLFVSNDRNRMRPKQVIDISKLQRPLHVIKTTCFYHYVGRLQI